MRRITDYTGRIGMPVPIGAGVDVAFSVAALVALIDFAG
jgi:hypothetical protein